MSSPSSSSSPSQRQHQHHPQRRPSVGRKLPSSEISSADPHRLMLPSSSRNSIANPRVLSTISNSSSVLTTKSHRTRSSSTYLNLLNQIKAEPASSAVAHSRKKTLNPDQSMLLDSHGHPTRSPVRKFIARLIKSGKSRSKIVSYSILFALLWKSLIGLGPYSGYRSPPLFGDLEAQRHWMALTVQLDLPRWYSFDLQYWGLDYPPLTAYHSLLLGHLAKIINPKFISLRPPSSSDLDGWGDQLHEGLKVFLRSTVLISELLIWIPIVTIYHFKTFSIKNHPSEPKAIIQPSSATPTSDLFPMSDRLWLGAMYSILVVLLNPNLILIDNGHFQFNSIMLGFTLASLTSFYSGRDGLGAVMFICSLSFKQMALYYSPAIFAYLFGKCLYLGHPNGTKLFLRLASVSIGTTLLFFGPFILVDSDFPQLIFQVLRRIFPIGRGLFEDKVGNFWCTLNVLIKIRTLGTAQSLANLALLFTLVAILPGTLIMIILNWKIAQIQSSSTKPLSPTSNVIIPKTVELLPLTLYNSSIAFYLFSFQVHEKSILLAVLPLLLILSRHQKYRKRDYHDALKLDWDIICLISNVSVFSMWPLLRRDGLGLQYLVSLISYNHIIGYNPLYLIRRQARNMFSLGILTIYLAMIAIHILEQIVEPPSRLPDLYVVMNLSLSFVVFSASYLWSLIRIYKEAWTLIGFKTQADYPQEGHSHQPFLNKFEDRNFETNSIEKNYHQVERNGNTQEQERVDELEVKLPTKRSASLQQQRSTDKARLGSESDQEEFKTRSVGATTGRAGINRLTKRMLKDSNVRRSGASSKVMISSPSGEKLMNRIKNRLQLEASRSSSHRSNSSRSSSPSNLQDRRRLSSEIRIKEIEPGLDRLEREVVESQTISPKTQTIETSNHNHQDENGRIDPGVEGLSSDFDGKGPIVSDEETSHTHNPINKTWKDDTDSKLLSNNQSYHHLKIESSWEIALRQSREEAIRRRREELLNTRNLIKR